MKKILHTACSMDEFSFETSLTVLGMNNFYRKYTKRYIEDLIEICSNLKNVELWIKPHYNQSEFKEYENVPNVKVWSHQADTIKLESKCDVLVTVESTTIIEALLFNKAVVLLNYTNDALFSDWTRCLLFAYARNKKELKRALIKCLYGVDINATMVS